jgi:Lipocalin-like domain
MGAVEGDALVGTWRLIAASASVGDTKDSSPFGRSPSGLLIYTRDGTMAALISYDKRKPFSVADWIAAPSDEHADAFTTFVAYGGRYALADGRVTHRVEVASVENWVNTDLVRAVKLDGDRLTLRTPSILVGGTERVMELVRERVERG